MVRWANLVILVGLVIALCGTALGQNYTPLEFGPIQSHKTPYLSSVERHGGGSVRATFPSGQHVDMPAQFGPEVLTPDPHTCPAVPGAAEYRVTVFYASMPDPFGGPSTPIYTDNKGVVHSLFAQPTFFLFEGCHDPVFRNIIMNDITRLRNNAGGGGDYDIVPESLPQIDGGDLFGPVIQINNTTFGVYDSPGEQDPTPPSVMGIALTRGATIDFRTDFRLYFRCDCDHDGGREGIAAVRWYSRIHVDVGPPSTGGAYTFPPIQPPPSAPPYTAADENVFETTKKTLKGTKSEFDFIFSA